MMANEINSTYLGGYTSSYFHQVAHYHVAYKEALAGESEPVSAVLQKSVADVARRLRQAEVGIFLPKLLCDGAQVYSFAGP